MTYTDKMKDETYIDPKHKVMFWTSLAIGVPLGIAITCLVIFGGYWIYDLLK